MIATILDARLDEAAEAGQALFSSPFEDLNQDIVYTQEFRQLASKRKPLAIGTQSRSYPSFYLTSESRTFPAGPGIVQWTREYARIPPRRTVPESYAWTVPGLGEDENQSIFGQIPLSSATANVASSTKLVCTSDHNMTVGSYVLVRVTVSFGAFQQTLAFRRVVTFVLSNLVIYVDAILDVGTNPFWVSVQKVDSFREPLTKEVPSWLQMDYFLPGVSPNIQRMEDITILEPEVIIDATGRETQSYTITSNPSRAQYVAKINARQFVIAVASTVRIWRGNIYERATRFVRAQ